MSQLKNCIATSGLIGALLILCIAPAVAGVAIGTVTNLSGPLFLKRADGELKPLAVEAFVEQGDVLVSEKNTYAQLRFADDSEITLGPDTQLKIDAYTFNVHTPDNRDSIFTMEYGSVQIKTGLTGGNDGPDRIKLVVPNLTNPVGTLTVSRAAGNTLTAQYTAPAPTKKLALNDSGYRAARYPATQLAWNESGTRTDGPRFAMPANSFQSLRLAQSVPPAPGAGGLAAGLYVHVIDGIINLTNKGGSLNFSAGQFGYTPSIIKPPVIVPANPGIQFTPPPAFSSSTRPSASSTGSGAKPKTVDCEVR